MSLAESIKTLLKTPEELLLYRLQAAKFFFVICTLLFFANYIFIGTGFFSEIAQLTFTYTYTALILSMFLYTTFVLLYYIRGKMRPLAYSIIAFFFLLLVLFSLPLVTTEEAFNHLL